ncbi:MAG: type II secretion protein ATPase [Proteobacteria bacterium]|nr:type II secretion protein ATPase [Pseudomonadota bacterium]
MSQEDITSILLPASRVDFYATDTGTAALAQRLTQDWRFARVAIHVEQAGIDAAINHYRESATPELIIIETDDISDGFIAQLNSLSGVCAAGTDAVVIGPKNDVHLYRALVEMGVKDYLVRPVSETDMVKVIAKTLIEKRGISGSRLVAVVGSKGGVGATTVAQVMAWTIADLLKQKTMLMDAAGSAGSIGIAYGLEPATTRVEAVRLGGSGSEDDMKRISQTISEHLSAMICGGDPLLTESPDPDGVELLVNRIMQKYPIVVVDLSGASPMVQKRLLARAAEIVLVTTPMLSALRNSRTLLSELKALKSHLKEVDLIVNMEGMATSEEVPASDIEASLGTKPSAVIRYLPKIFAASETTGKPIGQNNLASKIIDALMPIAAKAAATEYKGDTNKQQNKDLMSIIKKALGK